MLIHSLDLAQRSGWAIGPAGEVPNSGFLMLRKKDQSITHAGYNLQRYLEMVWGKSRPELVVYEAPMSLQAWHEQSKRRQRPQNAAGLEHLIRLAHTVETTAYGLGLRCEVIHRVSVMWKVTGQQTWGSYEENKKAVIRCLIRQKMLPFGCTDNDRADAVAMHVVASGKFAGRQHSTFGLFAEID